jgi:hypothetical protein
MQRYYEMLRRRVLTLNLSYLQFFEVAHQAIFGRVGSLNDDYCQFLQHAVVPKYVEAYLDRLAMEENVNHQGDTDETTFDCLRAGIAVRPASDGVGTGKAEPRR